IADVKITNAMIQSVSAVKINTGTLDAERVTVQVKNGTKAIKITDKVFKSVDSSGNVRIHIGVRDIGRKVESDQSTIRFFSGSGSTSAGIGMNVNDHFIIGSSSNKVAMELRSGKNTIMYAAQVRIAPEGANAYWKFLKRNSADGDPNPIIEP